MGGYHGSLPWEVTVGVYRGSFLRELTTGIYHGRFNANDLIGCGEDT